MANVGDKQGPHLSELFYTHFARMREREKKRLQRQKTAFTPRVGHKIFPFSTASPLLFVVQSSGFVFLSAFLVGFCFLCYIVYFSGQKNFPAQEKKKTSSRTRKRRQNDNFLALSLSRGRDTKTEQWAAIQDNEWPKTTKKWRFLRDEAAVPRS